MKAHFDELEQLLRAKIDDFSEENITKEELEDEIEDLLIIAYSFGNQDANSWLDLSIEPTQDAITKALFIKIKGETFIDRLRNDGNVEVITLTEAHRCYNQAILDVGKRSEMKLVKRWVTRDDDKVRTTHQYLEGMEVSLDKEFFTIDGDSARFPGDFSKAENNVNCRCHITLHKAK